MNRWIKGTAAALATIGSFGAVSAIAATAPASHVIIISIDGLHQADLTDPALRDSMPNILKLNLAGVEYTNASSMKPSDSFPGTLAYLTGAGPATTGIYYDDSYSRKLVAPGKLVAGTEITNTEEIDLDSDLLSGDGTYGASNLDPAKLPTDPNDNSIVWPHNYLKVNTIFEVAHATGLRTAFMDKHPAYEIANGPSGKGVDDLFCPEIDASAAILDNRLIDRSSPRRVTVTFTQITKSVPLAMAYDDLKLGALLNMIHGQNSTGSAIAPMPSLIGINFQALNIAEKDVNGGIDMVDGKEQPSQQLLDALKHTDDDIGTLVDELKAADQWDNTLVVITAKHGQNPRVGSATVAPTDKLTKPLSAAGIELSQATLDDVALLWLKDSSQTQLAAQTLEGIKSGPSNFGSDQILWGDSLKAANLAGDPDRTPDLIVTLTPGTMLSDKNRRSEHGGFSDDDSHVAMILTGGAIPDASRGHVVDTDVTTKQIAVTALDALELDPAKLQGAVTEKTTALPESGISGAANAGK